MFLDKGKVVIELVGDDWSVAVAKNKMRKIGNDDDAKKDADRKNGKNAGVRVFGEKIVPFFQNVAKAMGNKNGHG